jgi:hypothetical protein
MKPKFKELRTAAILLSYIKQKRCINMYVCYAEICPYTCYVLSHILGNEIPFVFMAGYA